MSHPNLAGGKGWEASLVRPIYVNPRTLLMIIRRVKAKFCPKCRMRALLPMGEIVEGNTGTPNGGVHRKQAMLCPHHLLLSAMVPNSVRSLLHLLLVVAIHRVNLHLTQPLRKSTCLLALSTE